MPATTAQVVIAVTEGKARVRVDLHSHTCFSPDSDSSFESINAAVRRRGLHALAITDHNEIEGALRLRDLAPYQVIVGEEISTSEGEIIGLFLERHIPPRLSPAETIARIREQNGLVYVPHPFDQVRRRSALKTEALQRLIDQIDLLEVFNARVTIPWDNWQAERFAREHGLRRGAGSDAHLAAEIGGTWLELDVFAGPQEFLASLEGARVGGRLANPLVHAATRWLRIRRRLAARFGRGS